MNQHDVFTHYPPDREGTPTPTGRNHLPQTRSPQAYRRQDSLKSYVQKVLQLNIDNGHRADNYNSDTEDDKSGDSIYYNIPPDVKPSVSSWESETVSQTSTHRKENSLTLSPSVLPSSSPKYSSNPVPIYSKASKPMYSSKSPPTPSTSSPKYVSVTPLCQRLIDNDKSTGKHESKSQAIRNHSPTDSIWHPASAGLTANSDMSPSDHFSSSRFPSWYWGNISRIEAEEKLRNLPDGSFLVRDSTTPGAYTLTVRHSGQNRCLKIFSHENKYGLMINSCVFNSLSDLIDHYSKHTLAEFNRELTTHLLYDVGKPHLIKVSMYKALSMLLDAGRELQSARQKYFSLLEKQEAANNALKVAQLELIGRQTARLMYEDLINNSAQTEDDIEEIEGLNCFQRRMYEENKTLSMKRHMAYINLEEKLKKTVSLKEEEQMKSQQLLNAQVSSLMDLEEHCTAIREQVLENGARPELVECLLDESHQNTTWDRSLWLVDCTRQEAEESLADKDVGTFLIRHRNEHEKPYALSIVCSNEDENDSTDVKHCIIHHPEGRGFGFRPDGAVFESIDELVSRHDHISIKIYFSHMDTCLLYPVLEKRPRGNSDPARDV